MSELDDLKKEIADLKQKIDPPPRPPSTHQPHDYTQGMSMPREAIRDLINAVPDALMRDLRGDARKPNPVTGGPNPQPTSQVQRGSGWQQPRPLEPPPGIAIMDRMMDEQDKIDKAELALRIAKARMAKGEG